MSFLPELLQRRPGCVGETFPRRFSEITGNIAALVSGQAHVNAMPLQVGVPVNHLTFKAGSTGAGTPLNQWAFLTDALFNVVALSADLTTAPWTAQTEKTFTLSAAFSPGASALFYAGLVVVATVVPTMDGITNAQGGGNNETDLTPPLCFLGTSGLTTPATLPAATSVVAASRASLYAWAS